MRLESAYGGKRVTKGRREGATLQEEKQQHDHLVQHFKQFTFARNKSSISAPQWQNLVYKEEEHGGMSESCEPLTDSLISWPLTGSNAGLGVKCLAQGHLGDGYDRS